MCPRFCTFRPKAQAGERAISKAAVDEAARKAAKAKEDAARKAAEEEAARKAAEEEEAARQAAAVEAAERQAAEDAAQAAALIAPWYDKLVREPADREAFAAEMLSEGVSELRGFAWLLVSGKTD